MVQNMWKEFVDTKDRPKGKNRLITKLVTASIVLMLMFPTGVLADNVTNDVTVGGSDTFTLGGSTDVSYKIVATGGDGQSGCNAGDGSAATVTINTPSGVTATPGSLVFTTCNDFQPVTFTATAAGDYVITVSVSDTGSGTYHTTPATFTLHVLAPTTTPTDTTPPVITPDVSGTLGDNGWYVNDVTVSWNVDDPESAIASTSGCDTTVIDTDTAGMTLTCSATSAGGTNSQSVTIKRDATLPSISGSALPAPNLNGWNNEDVTVSFTCSDAMSGIGTCSSPITLSGEGSGQSVIGVASDHAGNSASATVSNINIDKTVPTVSVTGVAESATYILGSVPVAGCDTIDSLSGVATYASLSMSGGPVVGIFTATCSGATDNAGNSGATVTVTYKVIYNWNGFFQPVDNLPAWNSAKAGSAIPVKFSLSGDQGLGIFATGYPRTISIACENSVPINGVEETVTAGKSSLSYDPTKDQYNYVWKTDKSWTNCRQLQVKLIDGEEYIANFKFTK